MRLKWTAIFAASSPMILMFSWLLTSVGSVLPLIFFYPGMFSLGMAIGDTLAFFWTLLQFPIYGLILDLSKMKSKQKLAWAGISILHLVLIGIAMSKIEY